MTFTHLHLHSQYSLLDGAITFPALTDHLLGTGMKACALTDHGWCAGLIQFYKECRKKEIKSILGSEVYLTKDKFGAEQKTRDNFHAVLLAKDKEGYHGLLSLCSDAALKNFYYKPRIYIPELLKLKGHVIYLSACLAGLLTKLALFDKENRVFLDPENKVLQAYKMLCDILGQDNVFLELQDWDDGTGIQPAWNTFLIELADEFSIPLVVTTDAHYLKEEDHKTHELMMAMQLKTTLEQYRQGSVMRYGPWFWVRPPEMMLESAKELGVEAAYHNTAEIAFERCQDIDLELGVPKPPMFDPTTAKDFEEFQKWMRKRNET